MALNTNPFVEGIDPSGTFGGYASVLLQLIRQAQPSSTYGMILFDTATPDVTGANAWRKRCIWVNLTTPGTPTVNVYKEGGSPGWSNVQALIPPDTITTAMIKNAAVTLAKLSVAGGTANQLIRVNAGGTAFEFVSLSSLVVNGSISIGSLITTGIPAGQFRLAGTYGPGVANWYTAQNVVDNLANGVIAADLIAPAPAATTRSKFLTGRTGDPFATWRFFEPNVDILTNSLDGGKLVESSISPSKIVPSAVEGALLTVSGGVADWTPAPNIMFSQSSDHVLPTGNKYSTGLAISTIPLGGKPDSLQITYVCKAAHEGYNIGDELAGPSLVFDGGDDVTLNWAIVIDANQVVIFQTGFTNVWYANKTSGSIVNELFATFSANFDMRIRMLRLQA